jgi:tyrosine-specific transport protein
MGLTGRRLAMVCYFFLLVALNVAYLSGATAQILSHLSLDDEVKHRLITASFLAFGGGWLAAAHTERVDRVNRVLFLGLIACFMWMMAVSLPSIDVAKLEPMDWSKAIGPLALIFTAFGYHPIIPNIFEYLGRDIKRTRLAIVIGSFVPLWVYFLWQLAVLGNVPLEGPQGLLYALEIGQPATMPLAGALQIPSLVGVMAMFAMFAILTSFLGTMLSLCEFVADAFGWAVNDKTRPRIALGLAGPLLALTFFGKNLFLLALGYAGIWAALLIGCLPIAMAAIVRKRHQTEPRPYLVKGGYGLMLVSFLFFFLIALIELASHF